MGMIAKNGPGMFWWVGAFFVGVGLCVAGWDAVIIVFGVNVDGVAVAEKIERRPGEVQDCYDCRYLVVDFVDPATKKTIRRSVSLPLPPWHSFLHGERVALTYWSSPGLLVLNCFWDTYVSPIISLLFGALFVALHYVVKALHATRVTIEPDRS